MFTAIPSEVIICRLGHASREAEGYDFNNTLRCTKLVNGKKCLKKAFVMNKKLAKNIYVRGYRASTARSLQLLQRAYDAFMMELAALYEAYSAAKA